MVPSYVEGSCLPAVTPMICVKGWANSHLYGHVHPDMWIRATARSAFLRNVLLQLLLGNLSLIYLSICLSVHFGAVQTPLPRLSSWYINVHRSCMTRAYVSSVAYHSQIMESSQSEPHGNQSFEHLGWGTVHIPSRRTFWELHWREFLVATNMAMGQY